jgi:hypothetical protein
MTLRRRHTITAAVANELSTSLRAKRGNPEQRLREKDWIASAFALRASADAVVARAPKKKQMAKALIFSDLATNEPSS